MGLNSDKPHLWKADVEKSIDFYNDWFLRFAPETYRQQRKIRTKEVIAAFEKTADLTQITPDILRQNPGVLPMLRMITAPPLARDRLMGLSYVGKNLIESMEGKDAKPPRLPSRMPAAELTEALTRICDVIAEVADRDLFPWLDEGGRPDEVALDRAATVVVDRLCGAAADPIIRNAQEKRQLTAIGRWLKRQGYRQISTEEARDPRSMSAGTYTFRLGLPAGKSKATVSVPIDCVIKPVGSAAGEMPVFIDGKSAGATLNIFKRWKEDAQKFTQLKMCYGRDLRLVLVLCGYFGPEDLGSEAAEGIDWVWEHRLADLGGLLSLAPKNSHHGKPR